MTKEELANTLDGRIYGNEIDQATERAAAAAGLVVVFGASDDLIEFRGAINDEEGGPGKVMLTPKGVLRSRCAEAEECPYFRELEKEAPTIEALWGAEGKDGPTWSYRTTIPHATFNIHDEDEFYCRGIVFELAHLSLGKGAL